MDELVSIIVPVYNVEKYLRPCLDSILAQTYKNLEIILVDDGSPDHSGAICDEFAARDPRVRVIHKTNGGLSDARNAGLDIATGDYIGFVDSDDWIAEDMFEYLLRNILVHSADIAECGYYNVFPASTISNNTDNVIVYNTHDALTALLQLKIGNYAWNKLYKHSLFNDIRYPKGLLYEDVRTTYRLFAQCSTVVSLPEPKYYYRENTSGIVQNPTIGNKISCVESRMSRYRILNDSFPELRSQLLREIFIRYCMELRDVICLQPAEEFEAQKDSLAVVTDFLREYSGDILQYAKPGFLERLELKHMCAGTRKDWLRCGKLAKIQEIIRRLEKTNTWKRIKKKKKKLKEQTFCRRYYYKCLQLPIDNNLALLESRGGQDFASNIFYIAKELQSRGVRVVVSVWENDAPKIQRLLKIGGLESSELVFRNTKPYYKAFATAKYLFSDMVYSDTILKREGQIWVNVWHGTPLKCLEFDVKNQRHELGGAAREFLRTDYLAVPSDFMLDKLVDSARVRNLLSITKALYCGYPRNQVFFDDARRGQLRKEKQIDDKEVFVYMPTWRGTFYNHTQSDGTYSLLNTLRFFDETLKDNQILYVKLHNFDSSSVNFNSFSKVFPFPADCEPYEFLNTADCLITDYSSVFFDYANTGRKIVLFTHDREKYLSDRGLYISLDDLPFPKVNSFEELRGELNLQKGYDDAAFRAAYCTYDCADAAKKLIDHVLGVVPCETSPIHNNGKKNILYYDARFLYRPYKPENAIKTIASFDDTQANYFYGYKMKATKRCPKYLSSLPEEYGPYVLANLPVYTLWQWLLLKVFRYPSRRLSRYEANREMYGLPFDEIHIIDANPYDEHVRILPRYRDYKIK